MEKQNAPALGKREGIECRLNPDVDALTITAVRLQHLNRFGIPPEIAALVASLAFGEPRHV